MADVANISDHEQRGLDRRVEVLERRLSAMDTSVAVMQATLSGLKSTVDSRHDAFARGQDLILKTLEPIERAQIKFDADLKNLAQTPQDISKLVFSPGVLVAIIAMILSIVGGLQAATWGLRGNIDKIDTRMSSQAEISSATQKLQDERAATLRNMVDEITKAQKLQQLEVQSLREMILNQRNK